MAIGRATTFLQNKLIAHASGGTAYTMPTLYMALLSANPTASGDMTNEVANSGAYSRASGSGVFGTPSDGVVTTTSEITFAEATGAWGLVTYIAMCDSATWNGGDMLYYAELDFPFYVNSTNVINFPTGSIIMKLV